MIFISSSKLCLKGKQFYCQSTTAVFKITDCFLLYDRQESLRVEECT